MEQCLDVEFKLKHSFCHGLVSTPTLSYPDLTHSNECISLELNIHQRILSDIASRTSQSAEDASYAKSLIIPKVQTRLVKTTGVAVDVEDGLAEPLPQLTTTRVYMVWLSPA